MFYACFGNILKQYKGEGTWKKTRCHFPFSLEFILQDKRQNNNYVGWFEISDFGEIIRDDRDLIFKYSL